MRIHSIFENTSTCKLWTVEFKLGKKDVFAELFDQWNDTEFLVNFFTENKELLRDPFWKGISINQAIDQVLDEAQAFENELYEIEELNADEQSEALGEIFQPLHKTLYEIKHRKGKPNFVTPMLRLYAIKLNDGSIVITGGAIKLTKTMEGELFEQEKQKLKIVQQYLKSENVDSSEELGDL